LELVEVPTDEIALYFNPIWICDGPIEESILREGVRHVGAILAHDVDVVVYDTEDSAIDDAVDANEHLLEMAGVVVNLGSECKVKAGG